ncbi:MAG TPA: tyrosine--tRNA ligase [Solirubrobacterales bacterium]|nr:tyrosine--tRNA ligase [Solirubrobacterales bacterium]
MSSRLWDFLHARAVEIHVGDHLRERLGRGEKLRVKLGIDPTAPDIHVGHLVVLDVLRAFQEDGHTVVLIVGDFTARIGDPSGRSETRPVLTKEQVDVNARTYFDQASLVLRGDRIEVHGNAEWLAELDMAGVLKLLGATTLQQVLQREDFAVRLREGLAIGAHEILYPFNQAYDSVAIRADIEIGGSDQLFNLLFGREVQRAYGQEPQDVAVFPLLEGLDGVQRMSKSLGNYIGIAEPPEQIYGKAMSLPDTITEKYARLVCDFDPADLDRVLQLGPRDAKAAMARQLVKRLHGEEAAGRAEADFRRRFVEKELPVEVPEVIVPAGATAHEGAKLAFGLSSAQLRDAFAHGGVRANGEAASADQQLQEGDLLQFGKHRFARVKHG